jgi:hypothetical protein
MEILSVIVMVRNRARDPGFYPVKFLVQETSGFSEAFSEINSALEE